MLLSLLLSRLNVAALEAELLRTNHTALLFLAKFWDLDLCTAFTRRSQAGRFQEGSTAGAAEDAGCLPGA